jgi:cell division protease FtsH
MKSMQSMQRLHTMSTKRMESASMGCMNDPLADLPAWLEERRVTIQPVDASAIVGIGHAQAHLTSLLGRLRFETLPGTLPPPVRSVLLHGPAGTGKTLTARWFASQLDGFPAYDLPAEQLTAEIIRAAFAVLANAPRSIVFLAEIDAIGLDRRDSDGDGRRALFALLEALDGLIAIPAGRGPLVIATTNRELGELDRALTRPGRIGVHVLYGLPTIRERSNLFRSMAAPWTSVPEPDWGRLAELSARWSPADIRGAVDDAVGLALMRGGAGTTLADEDLVGAVLRGSRVEPEDETSLAERPQIAIHEAGHVAVAVAMGRPVRSVRLGIGRRSSQTQTGSEDAITTSADLWAGAVSAFGGIAAEELLCDEPTAGGESDVRRATDLLIMRIEMGLDREFAPISRRAWGGGWTPLAIDDLVVPRVVAEIAVAQATARAIVEREAEAIMRFAQCLLANPVLSGSALTGALRTAGWSSESSVESLADVKSGSPSGGEADRHSGS